MLSLIKRRSAGPRAQLQELLGTYELPSLSSSLIHLLSLLRDPDVPMAEVAARVELDPGLTVRILRLINSAGFGLLSQVSNLQHAVSLLGRSRLESLVLTFAATDRIPVRMACMETGRFWGTAARRAALARVLAQHLHAATQAEAFTAGLLQDMAVPVLAGLDPEAYSLLLGRCATGDEASLAVLEREHFGFDHASVGALMAEDWGLPEYLIRAVRDHHQLSGGGGADPAVRLAAMVGYGPDPEGRGVLQRAAEAGFGIDAVLMEEMMDRAFTDAEQFAGMFYQ